MIQTHLENRFDLRVVEVQPECFADEPQHLPVVGLTLHDEIESVDVPGHRLILNAVLGRDALGDHVGPRELDASETLRAHLIPEPGEQVQDALARLRAFYDHGECEALLEAAAADEPDQIVYVVRRRTQEGAVTAPKEIFLLIGSGDVDGARGPRL